MCIFISCVSPKMCLFWMFVLNGFSYPGVRSSWKSVLSGKNSGMTFCLCVCNSKTTINFQSCYKQRLQKGKCVCYVGSTLWDKQNNLELSEVTALLWAHGFIFITLRCRWNADHASCQLPLSASYLLPFCAFRANFSPDIMIPSSLVSFWLFSE